MGAMMCSTSPRRKSLGWRHRSARTSQKPRSGDFWRNELSPEVVETVGATLPVWPYTVGQQSGKRMSLVRLVQRQGAEQGRNG